MQISITFQLEMSYHLYLQKWINNKLNVHRLIMEYTYFCICKTPKLKRIIIPIYEEDPNG